MVTCRNMIASLCWICILLEIILPFGLSQKKNSPSDCEKQAPIGFNAAQKALLCTGHDSKGDVGPGMCASTAKELLKGTITVDDIIQLCQGAMSSSPAKCIQAISDSSSRKLHGKMLCKLSIMVNSISSTVT